MAQFLAVRELIILPHSSFNRLADDAGDPMDRRMTFVNNTGRCGSTLLVQMISQTPRSRVISEPWCFSHINFNAFERTFNRTC